MENRSDSIVSKRRGLEALFQKHDYTNFKWIEPEQIVVSHWVRMKCMFGCAGYGAIASCPPNLPSVFECQRFFREYTGAVIFHFEKKVDRPEDRKTWSRNVNSKLLKLERAVFLSGYERAFLLFMDSCEICTECPGKKDECKEPRLSRPTPEGMAVDVYTTVRKVGYPIEVCKEYSQKMDRYAFLMIE